MANALGQSLTEDHDHVVRLGLDVQLRHLFQAGLVLQVRGQDKDRWYPVAFGHFLNGMPAIACHRWDWIFEIPMSESLGALVTSCNRCSLCDHSPPLLNSWDQSVSTAGNGLPSARYSSPRLDTLFTDAITGRLGLFLVLVRAEKRLGRASR